MLYPIKVNSNTIELAAGHTSCYCILDLLCVKSPNHSTLFALFGHVCLVGKFFTYMPDCIIFCSCFVLYQWTAFIYPYQTLCLIVDVCISFEAGN